MRIVFLILIIFYFSSCKQDKGSPETQGYPLEVGQIILTKCAVTGCHNNVSFGAAAGLNLSSWDKLFEGGNGGSSVIPFRSDFSTLCYYVNTFPELGPTLNPTMPIANNPLSKDEVNTLFNWIDKGAPNNLGEIKFASNSNRKKIYVLNQGCRLATVIDQESLLQMRCVNVESGNVSPHMVRVAPDKQFWYTISIGGQTIRKFSCVDDKFVGQITIGLGNYNTFSISSDSKKAYIIDFSANAKIVEVDLENLLLLNTYSTTDWANIHGSCLSPDNQFLYVTSQYQNRIFKIPVADFSAYTEVVMNAAFSSTLAGVTDPHEIIFSPDASKYFVSCNTSNEVRVFNASNDSLIAVISVGQFPVEFSLSLNQPYLFVSCMEDQLNLIAPTTGKKGVVSVINYQTNTLITHIDGGFYQPHGLAVDDEKGLLYVASRNQETNGPTPHHTTTCGGRNGYLTFIQLSNFQKFGKRIELASDPYSVTLR